MLYDTHPPSKFFLFLSSSFSTLFFLTETQPATNQIIGKFYLPSTVLKRQKYRKKIPGKAHFQSKLGWAILLAKFSLNILQFYHLSSFIVFATINFNKVDNTNLVSNQLPLKKALNISTLIFRAKQKK